VASVGHVAIGLLLARAYPARSPRERHVARASFAGLALLPDADVIGVSLGLVDGTLWGHRGYSHSLLFAAVVAVGAFLLAPRWDVGRWTASLLAFVAVSSHGLLDAITFDSRGIPFFWPLVDTRLAFPWRVIPPAPHGIAYLSHRGLGVTLVEALYFLPILLAALAPWNAFRRLAPWRRRPLAQATGLVCAAALLVLGSLALGHTLLGRTRLVEAFRDSGRSVHSRATQPVPPAAARSGA
jgi:inner membrane protein